MQRLRIKITGQVQGVGFRPFIYRIAQEFQLIGWVKNRSGEVITVVQGETHQLDAFQHAILNSHPPLAIPTINSVETLVVDEEKYKQFSIKSSTTSEHAERHIPPDFFTCDDCLAELSSSKERRYRYPFINCTQCGPRYTLIRDLPYDRPNTSLSEFPLCSDCFKEYSDTLDRRFHAQPLACEVCGPELSFFQVKTPEQKVQGNEDSLKLAISCLKRGEILAVKGVGGYHLICDAKNESAVQTLRQRKHRPDKPLAIMFFAPAGQELEQLNHYCQPTNSESEHLLSPQRPIVLIKSKQQNTLAKAINPGLNEIGAMLAYSPLHYLLLKDFGAPIVATSGNLSGEPVQTDNEQTANRLNTICDAFLQHNRPILRPADDSVIRVIANKARLFRVGRGLAPLELNLAFHIKKPLLAVGGQMKNTIALAWGNRVVISPHIGELDNKRSIEVFAQVIDDLCQLYRVKPKHVICDKHPDYYSSRYAQQYAKQHNIPISRVQHHRAHASIVYGELLVQAYNQTNKLANHKELKRSLIFTWDGTGLGDDQNIWGGEAFYGRAGHWQRVCSIKPFYLQGGDKVGKQPWRSACALLWSDKKYSPDDDSSSKLPDYFHKPEHWQISNEQVNLSYQAWKKRLNTLTSSSIGRLFDAASALIGIGEESSFEGQGPTFLEGSITNLNINNSQSKSLPLYQSKKNNDNELILADWSELIPLLMNQQLTTQQKSLLFHQKMAETLIAQAKKIRQQKGEFMVGLSGGVFQNKVLSEMVLTRLKEENFEAYLPEKVPYNDAGLSFGQIIESLDR